MNNVAFAPSKAKSLLPAWRKLEEYFQLKIIHLRIYIFQGSSEPEWYRATDQLSS